MFAADVALIALGVGLAGLCVFTASMLMGIHIPERRRRRARDPLGLPPTPSRRVITGAPARLPDVLPPIDGLLALPAGAPAGELPDAAARLTALQDAERTILRLMDEDPQAVVRVISWWLAQDVPPPAHEASA